MEVAARAGNLEVLRHLRKLGFWPSSRLIPSAAASGDLSVFQWAYRHRGDCASGWIDDVEVTSCAAAEGHLEMLVWCREVGCAWDESACALAALKGHLHILEYCRNNGALWGWDTAYSAVLCGQLNILEYCIGEGCPESEMAVELAAGSGRLDMLKLMHANGWKGPKNRWALQYAVDSGSTEVVEWLQSLPDDSVL
tara:strand:+ start:620 stop:1207 length:588 start_codon:yes stop_codon:yes gene_type:complete